MTRSRRRPSADIALRTVALSIATIAVAVSAWGISDPMRRVGPVWIVAAACVVSYGGIGLLLIQHRPRHMAGWMLLGVGMLLSFLSYGPGLISVVGLSLWMPWLGNDTVWFSLAILLVSLVLLVGPFYLPDGRLPSPRWRFPAVVVGLCWSMIALELWRLQMGIPVLPDDGIGLAAVWVAVVFSLVVLAVAPWLAIAARFRGTSGIERQQVKVVAFALLLILGTFAFAAAPFSNSIRDVRLYPFLGAISLLPIAIAFAVLRYGLYSIDTLISRAFVYGTATALLTVGFALMSRVGELLPGSDSTAGVVATAVLLAVAFPSLRQKVQEFVDARLKPPQAPAQHLNALRAPLTLIAEAHAPADLAERVLVDAVTAFGALRGRVQINLEGAPPIVRSVGAASAIPDVTVALTADGGSIGMLELGPRRSGEPYRGRDLTSLQELCTLAASALSAQIAAHGAAVPHWDAENRFSFPEIPDDEFNPT